MEDYSAIIWVVIFGAAMIFSAISKARKGQQQGGKTAHEAWPTLFGTPEVEETAPETASESPYGEENAPEGAHHSYEDMEEHPSNQGENHKYAAHTADSGEDTYFSYEDAGDWEAERMRRESNQIQAQAHPDIQARSRTPLRAAKHASESDISKDAIESAAAFATPEIGLSSNATDMKRTIEEFDLRTAVLYAEILKPKFNQ